MNSTYQRARDGKLRPRAGPAGTKHSIVNDTPLAVDVFDLASGKARAQLIQPSKSQRVAAANFHIVRAAASGALMSVIKTAAAANTYIVGPDLLTEPNNIGDIPTSTATQPIPTDSLRVMVGCSRLANGNIVTREQLWQRLGDSYSLAAKEKKTYYFAVKAGVQKISSQTETVAASVGTSASAGWGPISASVSASLSSTSTSSHQVQMKHETEHYVTQELTNRSKKDLLVFHWQLLDVVNILNKTDTTTVLASVFSGQTPVVTQTYKLPT